MRRQCERKGEEQETVGAAHRALAYPLTDPPRASHDTVYPTRITSVSVRLIPCTQASVRAGARHGFFFGGEDLINSEHVYFLQGPPRGVSDITSAARRPCLEGGRVQRRSIPHYVGQARIMKCDGRPATVCLAQPVSPGGLTAVLCVFVSFTAEQCAEFSMLGTAVCVEQRRVGLMALFCESPATCVHPHPPLHPPSLPWCGRARGTFYTRAGEGCNTSERRG